MPFSSVAFGLFYIGVPVVRTVGGSVERCTVTWLPNVLRWVDLLSFGAPHARSPSPWWDTSTLEGYPQQHVTGTYLYIHLYEEKQNRANISCLKKHRDPKNEPESIDTKMEAYNKSLNKFLKLLRKCKSGSEATEQRCSSYHNVNLNL